MHPAPRYHRLVCDNLLLMKLESLLCIHNLDRKTSGGFQGSNTSQSLFHNLLIAAIIYFPALPFHSLVFISTTKPPISSACVVLGFCPRPCHCQFVCLFLFCFSSILSSLTWNQVTILRGIDLVFT